MLRKDWPLQVMNTLLAMESGVGFILNVMEPAGEFRAG